MHTRSVSLLCLALASAHAATARAGGADGLQSNAERDYLVKVNVACGAKVVLAYDAASLAQHDDYIKHDQTDGANECNEGLRYLWYACQSAPGKAAVKAARIGKIVCRGTPGASGSLVVQSGTITIERAHGEKDAFVRSRRQLEAALHVGLQLAEPDPYRDDAWRKLRSEPNPVTSTTTYCVVNGNKIDLDLHAQEPFIHRKEDASIKCWQAGKVVLDLAIRKGVQTGFTTWQRDRLTMRRSYRDGKQDGEQRDTDDGKLKSLQIYADGRELSSAEYRPDGKLARYSRHHADHYDDVSFDAAGKLQGLHCSPQARGDAQLNKLCGFDGASTQTIYDGTGKVSRVVTYKDGVLAQEGAGDSEYARGSTVAYKDGKKHGEERVVDKHGKLRRTITWDRGVQDGKELGYADDGKKIVEEIVWKAGERKQTTEFFLNGNPSARETFETPTRKRRVEFWDTGKTRAEGTLLRCQQRAYGWRWSDWCEEGVAKAYYEDGVLESESNWHDGQRNGVAKSYWPSGKPESVEEYAAGTLTKAKRWDRDGKLAIDEEYEADGSRKLKR